MLTVPAASRHRRGIVQQRRIVVEQASLGGPNGVEWLCAAQEVADRLLVPLAAEVIDAPDWPRQVGRTDHGALLVRPGLR